MDHPSTDERGRLGATIGQAMGAQPLCRPVPYWGANPAPPMMPAKSPLDLALSDLTAAHDILAQELARLDTRLGRVLRPPVPPMPPDDNAATADPDCDLTQQLAGCARTARALALRLQLLTDRVAL